MINNAASWKKKNHHFLGFNLFKNTQRTLNISLVWISRKKSEHILSVAEFEVSFTYIKAVSFSGMVAESEETRVNHGSSPSDMATLSKTWVCPIGFRTLKARGAVVIVTLWSNGQNKETKNHLNLVRFNRQ